MALLTEEQDERAYTVFAGHADAHGVENACHYIRHKWDRDNVEFPILTVQVEEWAERYESRCDRSDQDSAR